MIASGKAPANKTNLILHLIPMTSSFRLAQWIPRAAATKKVAASTQTHHEAALERTTSGHVKGVGWGYRGSPGGATRPTYTIVIRISQHFGRPAHSHLIAFGPRLLSATARRHRVGCKRRSCRPHRERSRSLAIRHDDCRLRDRVVPSTSLKYTPSHLWSRITQRWPDAAHSDPCAWPGTKLGWSSSRLIDQTDCPRCG